MIIERRREHNIKLTRQNVLDAIEFEPLKSGTWVFIDEDNPNSNCNVCAVGGVLRRAGLPNKDIKNFGLELCNKGKVAVSDDDFYDEDDVEDQTEEALEQGHYLRALSIQFEYMSDVYKLEKVREKLKQWVLENIPETFESEIEWS